MGFMAELNSAKRRKNFSKASTLQSSQKTSSRRRTKPGVQQTINAPEEGEENGVINRSGLVLFFVSCNNQNHVSLFKMYLL